jgi:hypothetical protein
VIRILEKYVSLRKRKLYCCISKKGKMKFALIFFISFICLIYNCQCQTLTSETSPSEASTPSSNEPELTNTEATLSQLTESPPSRRPTQNPPKETTIAVPTTNPPLTTQSDIWAEFDIDCNTTEGYCVYKINAPQLDAETYNDDSSKFQTDKNEFYKASSIAAYDSSRFFADKVYRSFQNAKAQVENLTIEILALNDTVYEALAFAENETASIVEVYQNIKAIYSKLTNCYYQTCALVTPPPITTTTTPRPTTPNICDTTTCKYSGYPDGKCYVISGRPSCQCPGNLDQNNQCKQAGCHAPSTALKDGMVPGPFFSPNYTRQSTPSSYGSNLNCQYKITSTDNVKITVKEFKIDKSTTLYVNKAPILCTFTKEKLQQYLDEQIGKNTKSLTVSFKTGAVPSTGGPYFIDWEIEKL